MELLDVEQAASAVLRGYVVAAATETFFGLLALADDTKALDALLSMKPRTASKGIPLLLADRSEWPRWVRDIPRLAHDLADHFWPGPLTIALPAAFHVDGRLALDGSLAVRLPGVCPASEIAHRVGRAVTATSANLPGCPPATTPDQACETFGHFMHPSRLLLAEGTAPGGLPSTVLSVVSQHVHLSREGAVPVEAIERFLGRRVGEPRTVAQ